LFPILLKIGPVSIHTYGFMMAVGVASALWFIFHYGKKAKLPSSKLIDMAFYTIIIALIGSKIVLLIGNFSYYKKYYSELVSLARSGGVFQGGLAFGFFFALWYLKKHRLPFWKTADIVGPAIALGHGFGRIGCFSAGCCFGRTCDVPWAVTFSSEYAHSLTGIPLYIPLHPTQLYESILNFTNFLILLIILKRKKFNGQIFSLYIMNYSIIRYFVEFYRGDHTEKVYLFKNASPYMRISYPQFFCILTLIAGIILYLVLKKRKGD